MAAESRRRKMQVFPPPSYRLDQSGLTAYTWMRYTLESAGTPNIMLFYVMMSWCWQVRGPRLSVSPSAGVRVGSVASGNSDITGTVPSFRHWQKHCDPYWRTGSSHSGNTSRHQVHRCVWRCTGEQVITLYMCVMSEFHDTEVLHIPGLFGWSITQREKHRTVELQQQRGRVWRLLQQVQTQTYD